MTTQQPAFLKNWKTGVVFPYSKLLARQGHLVPCDRKGNPMTAIDADPGEDIAREKRKAPFLVNGKTGVVMPWTDLLAKQPHLHPCDSHAEGRRVFARIKAARDGRLPEALDEEAPAAPKRFRKEPGGVQSRYGTKGAQVARDPDYQLPDRRDETTGVVEMVNRVDVTHEDPLPPPLVDHPEERADPLDRMSKKEMLKLAKTKGVKLDGRVNEDILREQVRVVMAQDE